MLGNTIHRIGAQVSVIECATVDEETMIVTRAKASRKPGTERRPPCAGSLENRRD